MKFLLKLRWMAYLLILCIGFGGTAAVFAQDLPRYEENTLYVKFKDGSGISAKKMLDTKSDIKTIRTSMLGLSNNLMNRFKIEPEALSMSLFDNPVLDKTFMISVDPEAKAGIEQLMEELEKDPNVEYVERVPFNRIFSTDAVPPVNDPYYGIITGGEKTLNVSWHLDFINAEKAWQIQTGNPDIVVAVVDNAIWGEHEDLQIPSSRQYNCVTKVPGNSAPPAAAVNQNEQCSIQDLYNSGCISYDFSHGTHCAGAIAAINNNGIGIASIGSGVALMGVGGPSAQYPSGIMNSYHGVTWAASHGAKIISCSWGSDDFNRSNEAVMKACYDQGVIVIAAAGNDNIATPHYPAAYAPYVISVGSVDANKRKSNFSNYGHWVDILSPGGEDTTSYKTQIFSTTYCQNQYTRLIAETDIFTGKHYDEMSGTSMATPVLAGVVALMVSKDSTLTTDQIRAILQNSGQDLTGMPGYRYYNDYCRIVDAYAALQAVATAQFAPSVDSLFAETVHDSVWLSWKAPETTDPIIGYNIYRNGAKIVENHPECTFLNTNLLSGSTYRYAVEPVYKNTDLYTYRTEVDVTTKKYFSITAVIRPDDSYGYVEGAGQFEQRQIYTLTAHAHPGHNFEYWTDERGTKLFGATLSGPALQNRRYFAYFGSASNENLQLVKKAVRISPNPAKDAINIQCTDYELQHIRISDMQGRIVYNAGCIDCQTHSLNIGIGSWSKGTYIVQVTTSNGTVSHKLIKR